MLLRYKHMKKLLGAIVLAAIGFAALVSAQEHTLTTPVARTAETKHVIRDIYFVAGQVSMNVDVKDAGNVVIRSYIQRLPDAAFPSATVNGFWGTLLSAQAGETGSNQRVAQYRATVYLTAQGVFPPGTATP